ncbi:MAG: hypothetical protein IJ741_10220 [Schwartzia sp.]|nr:hypothetical protein [Schwartzia sp. (in: firmicutes)]
MTKMEKKIRDRLKMIEARINENKTDLAEKQEELIKRAQGKDSGMWITKIGKEMELLEDEIRQFARERKMLEYFLNDELEA